MFSQDDNPTHEFALEIQLPGSQLCALWVLLHGVVVDMVYSQMSHRRHIDYADFARRRCLGGGKKQWHKQLREVEVA